MVNAMSDLRICVASMTDGRGEKGHSHMCKEKRDHRFQHQCRCGVIWSRIGVGSEPVRPTMSDQPTQTCSYCEREFFAPVELHHHEGECWPNMYVITQTDAVIGNEYTLDNLIDSGVLVPAEPVGTLTVVVRTGVGVDILVDWGDRLPPLGEYLIVKADDE